MTLPTTKDLLRAIVIALAVALLGYLLYPLFTQADPRLTLVLGLFIATVAGALLSQLRLPAPVAGSSPDSTTTLFVGNLAFRTSQEELQELFAPFGPVHSLRIMKDRMTRRPRGFAFVELDARQASKAIRKLNEHEFNGRKLRVNESNRTANSAES